MNDYLPVYGRDGDEVPHGLDEIGGFFTHGGRFIRYSLFGNLFDLTAKFRPPIKPISRGAYGIVCSAVNGETREEVAIKKIANAFDNIIIAKRTLREIKILRHMDHDNILALREVIPPPQRERFNDVYLVTELMHTDLHHVIRDHRDITEEHYQYFLYQLLRGLKYIHSANVLHRDLKPSNLFVSEDCDLKIADFGFARTFSESDLMTEYVVTRWYRSPELLLNTKGYTAAVDMWSVGCILMELYNKEPLLPGRDYIHQFRLITELMGTPNEVDLSCVRSQNAINYIQQLPKVAKQPLAVKFPHLPPLAIDLIEKMLTYHPEKRITAEEALAHPYLSAMHDETDEASCPTQFNFDIEEQSLSEDDIRELIYQEAFMPYRHPSHYRRYAEVD